MTEHNLNTSAGGRGYIADLFRSKLKRHDFTRYIQERLAADFACVLAQHIESEVSESLQERPWSTAVELLNLAEHLLNSEVFTNDGSVRSVTQEERDNLRARIEKYLIEKPVQP